MKHFTISSIVMFLLVLVACTTKTSTSEIEDKQVINKETVTDGVFIHLSHGPEDPQRVLMALNMAKMMSDDKAVLLYLDIKGVFVALNDAPDIQFKAFPSSHQLLNELKEKGVEVIVCPGCLKAAEKTPEDVQDWVKIASKERFFDFCDGRIISIDY
jgi:predicted peroxiredoxin